MVEGGGDESEDDIPDGEGSIPQDQVFIDENAENTEEMVDPKIVEDIVNEIQQYESTGATQSALRRSARLKEKQQLTNMFSIPVTQFVGLGLQMELHEARSKYGVRAVRAAADEIKQMLRKDVWSGVPVEEMDQYQKPIPSSMKVKEKFKGGLLEKLKGRLTGGGHKQSQELYKDVKYAPTVSTSSIMAVACISAAEGRAVATLDFTGAFLYADVPTDKEKTTLVKLGQFLTRILVKLDPTYSKYVRPDGTCVVILKKALYGTIIAAAAWYKKISGDMVLLGYTINKYDNCVFYKLVLGKQLIVLIHVDDMKFSAAGGEAALDIAIDEIKGLYDEVTVHRGKKLNYIGMDFDYTKKGEVSVSMIDYVDNSIKIYEDKYGTLGDSRVPANDNIFKIDNNSERLTDEQAHDYVSHVMRQQYLAKHQRYDLSFIK